MDDLLGDLLYTTAMVYYAEYDVMDEVQARTMGVNRIRIPSEGVFKSTVRVNYVFGMASSVGSGGLVMDVDNNAIMVGPKDGSRDKFLQFMRSSGMNSSALEHSVPEQLFSTHESLVYGVSAVKAIQIAASQGMPIYTVTRENADTVIPQLSLDAATIQEIKNAVNAGNEVTVSKGFINYHGWIGCGYIVFNPTTGAGAYMIFGGDNGGEVKVPKFEFDNKDLGAIIYGTGIALLSASAANPGTTQAIRGMFIGTLTVFTGLCMMYESNVPMSILSVFLGGFLSLALILASVNPYLMVLIEIVFALSFVAINELVMDKFCGIQWSSP